MAIIEGAPNAFNGQQRKLGFEDAMKAAGMNIVSSQSGYWETDKANQVVAAMITEHPDLKAMLCANDSMALGAVAALRAAGKLGQVLVVGYDNIAAVQQLLKEGKVLATADQHADQLAVFGIEYALEMLKTKATPADRETPVDLVTAAREITGMAASPSAAVVARDLQILRRAGLVGASTWTCAPARCTRWWARTAPARARCRRIIAGLAEPDAGSMTLARRAATRRAARARPSTTASAWCCRS